MYSFRPDFFPHFSGVPFQAVCATIHDVHPANVDKENGDYIAALYVHLQDVIFKAPNNSMRVSSFFLELKISIFNQLWYQI